MTVPVSSDAAGDARNSATSAISSIFPNRRIGMARVTRSTIFSGKSRVMPSVSAMGPGAMPVIDLSWKLAVVQTERGEAEDGEALIASAVGTVRGILPEGHPQIGAMLSSWGECLARMERHGEAAERLREAYAILEAAEGVQNAERARVAAGRLGESLRAMGEEAEAERWEGLASVPTGGAGD